MSGSEVALYAISGYTSTSWCSGNMDLRQRISSYIWLLVVVSVSCCIISTSFILLSIFVWVCKYELIYCVSGCLWPASFVGSSSYILFGRIIFGSQCTLRLGVCSWFGVDVDSNFGCVPFVVFSYFFELVLSVYLLTNTSLVYHCDYVGISGTVWKEVSFFTWNWGMNNCVIGLSISATLRECWGIYPGIYWPSIIVSVCAI